MKKKKISTLLLITSLITINAKAQIQLNADDVIAKGFYKLNVDTAPFIQLGTPGGAKTWDFTNLKKHEIQNVTIAPFATNEPEMEANIVEIENGDTVNYYKKSNSNLKIVIPDEEFGYINLNIANFPFKYQSKTEDSIYNFYIMSGEELGFPLLDSVKLYFMIKFSTNCDSWGEIKLPSGNYNALRVRFDIENRIWAMGKVGSGEYISIPGMEQNSVSTGFRWFTKGKGFPIANYEHDDNIMTYFESGTLTTQNINYSKNSDIVVANPINESIIINNKANESCGITIRDINGKEILNKEINAGEQYKEDASFLPRGTYILQVNYRYSRKTFNSLLVK